MSRWILVAQESGVEDELPRWELVANDGEGTGSPEAWIYSLKIARRIKTALDWFDAFEDGLVSLPTKPRVAGTARPRPTRTKRHPRAKGLK